MMQAALIVGLFVFLSVVLANMALRGVLSWRDRLLLLGAGVSLAVAAWAGVTYADNRTLARSVDATIEYHKLMRKWEPIWAEQERMKRLVEKDTLRGSSGER